MLLTTQGLCYAAPKASSCFSHATLRLGRGLICQALSSQANTSALKLLPALPPSLPPSLRFPPPPHSSGYSRDSEMLLTDELSWMPWWIWLYCICHCSPTTLTCVSFLTALTLLSTANTSPLLFYHSLTTKACGFFLGGGTRSKSVKGSESPREE